MQYHQNDVQEYSYLSKFIPHAVHSYIYNKNVNNSFKRFPLLQSIDKAIILHVQIIGMLDISNALANSFCNQAAVAEIISLTFKQFIKRVAEVVNKYAGQILDIYSDQLIIGMLDNNNNHAPNNNEQQVQQQFQSIQDEELKIQTCLAVQCSLELIEVIGNKVDETKLRIKIGIGVGSLKIHHLGSINNVTINNHQSHTPEITQQEHTPAKTHIVFAGVALQQAMECNSITSEQNNIVVSRFAYQQIHDYFDFQHIMNQSFDSNENGPYFLLKGPTQNRENISEVNNFNSKLKLQLQSIIEYSSSQLNKSVLNTPHISNFSHYIPFQVQEYHSSNLDKWVDELRLLSIAHITILDLNIADINSQHGNEGTHHVYLTILEIAQRFHGNVFQIFADGQGLQITVVFGEQGFCSNNDAVSVVLAAQCIQSALDQQNYQNLKHNNSYNNKGKAVVKCGISTGVNFIGHLSTPLYSKYLIFGEALHRAYRHVQAAQNNQAIAIFADEQTKLSAECRIAFVCYSQIKYKSIVYEVNLFEPLHLNADTNRMYPFSIKTHTNNPKTNFEIENQASQAQIQTTYQKQKSDNMNTNINANANAQSNLNLNEVQLESNKQKSLQEIQKLNTRKQNFMVGKHHNHQLTQCYNLLSSFLKQSSNANFIVLLTGQVGVGKSMFVRKLLQMFYNKLDEASHSTLLQKLHHFQKMLVPKIFTLTAGRILSHMHLNLNNHHQNQNNNITHQDQNAHVQTYMTSNHFTLLVSRIDYYQYGTKHYFNGWTSIFQDLLLIISKFMQETTDLALTIILSNAGLVQFQQWIIHQIGGSSLNGLNENNNNNKNINQKEPDTPMFVLEKAILETIKFYFKIQIMNNANDNQQEQESNNNNNKNEVFKAIPLIIVLDNLQEFDQSSLGAIVQLMRQIPGVFVLACFTEDEEENQEQGSETTNQANEANQQTNSNVQITKISPPPLQSKQFQRLQHCLQNLKVQRDKLSYLQQELSQYDNFKEVKLKGLEVQEIYSLLEKSFKIASVKVQKEKDETSHDNDNDSLANNFNLAAFLADTLQGNPLTILSLFRHLLQDSRLCMQRNKQIRLSSHFAQTINLQECLEGVVLFNVHNRFSRLLDMLTTEQQLLLKICAGVGDIFDFHKLLTLNPFHSQLQLQKQNDQQQSQQTSVIKREVILKHLMQSLQAVPLLQTETMTQRNLFLRFKHPFLRELLYARFLLNQKRQLHTQVAKCLVEEQHHKQQYARLQSQRNNLNGGKSLKSFKLNDEESQREQMRIIYHLELSASTSTQNNRNNEDSHMKNQPQIQQVQGNFNFKAKTLHAKTMRALLIQNTLQLIQSTPFDKLPFLVIKEGQMDKKNRNSVFYTWKSRYVALFPDQIRIYKTKNHFVQDPLSNASSVILLKNVFKVEDAIVSENEVAQQIKKLKKVVNSAIKIKALRQKYMFHLSVSAWKKGNKEHPMNVFKFAVTSQTEFEEWMVLLDFQRAQANFSLYEQRYGNIGSHILSALAGGGGQGQAAGNTNSRLQNYFDKDTMSSPQSPSQNQNQKLTSKDLSDLNFIQTDKLPNSTEEDNNYDNVNEDQDLNDLHFNNSSQFPNGDPSAAAYDYFLSKEQLGQRKRQKDQQRLKEQQKAEAHLQLKKGAQVFLRNGMKLFWSQVLEKGKGQPRLQKNSQFEVQNGSKQLIAGNPQWSLMNANIFGRNTKFVVEYPFQFKIDKGLLEAKTEKRVLSKLANKIQQQKQNQNQTNSNGEPNRLKVKIMNLAMSKTFRKMNSIDVGLTSSSVSTSPAKKKAINSINLRWTGGAELKEEEHEQDNNNRNNNTTTNNNNNTDSNSNSNTKVIENFKFQKPDFNSKNDANNIVANININDNRLRTSSTSFPKRTVQFQEETDINQDNNQKQYAQKVGEGKVAQHSIVGLKNIMKKAMNNDDTTLKNKQFAKEIQDFKVKIEEQTKPTENPRRFSYGSRVQSLKGALNDSASIQVQTDGDNWGNFHVAVQMAKNKNIDNDYKNYLVSKLIQNQITKTDMNYNPKRQRTKNISNKQESMLSQSLLKETKIQLLSNNISFAKFMPNQQVSDIKEYNFEEINNEEKEDKLSQSYYSFEADQQQQVNFEANKINILENADLWPLLQSQQNGQYFPNNDENIIIASSNNKILQNDINEKLNDHSEVNAKKKNKQKQELPLIFHSTEPQQQFRPYFGILLNQIWSIDKKQILEKDSYVKILRIDQLDNILQLQFKDRVNEFYLNMAKIQTFQSFNA